MSLPFLAAAKTLAPKHVSLPAINHFPGQGDLIKWCAEMGAGTGVLFIILGVVFLMYGYSMFKGLITLNAAIIGAYVGAMLGVRFGGSQLIGGAVGALIAAAVTWPLMKWAVAVMGGIVGAMVGAGVWKIAGQDPNFAWAGAMTGLVGFGLFSFILFRGSIIMYTSLQGSLMLIVGALGLAFKYQEMAPKIVQSLNSQPMALPVALAVPAVLGLIYQQTHTAGASAGGSDGGEKK